MATKLWQIDVCWQQGRTSEVTTLNLKEKEDEGHPTCSSGEGVEVDAA